MDNIFISNETEFNKFIEETFENFNCRIDEYFFNGGNYEIELVDDSIYIDKVWIDIRNNSDTDNFNKVKEAFEYIKENSNIEFGVIDFCVF